MTYLILALFSESFTLTGFITVITEPTGADIHIFKRDNSEPVFSGKSPVKKLNIEEGIYRLEMNRNDYQAILNEEVAVFPGRTKEIFRTLDYNYGYLSITTSPGGSFIYMDDIMVGQSTHVNSLVLPGRYQIKIVPSDSLFKPIRTRAQFNRSDSIRIQRDHLYRSKTFEREHLSLAPWHLQFETGIKRTRYTGTYGGQVSNYECTPYPGQTCELPGTVSPDSNFNSNSVKTRLHFPITLRLSVPNQIEFHLHLPFTRYNPLMDSTGTAGPGDMKTGFKYTLRKYHVGLGAAYLFSTGNSASHNGQGYNSLEISGMGMMAKKGFQLFGNINYIANFSPGSNPGRNMGDKIQAYLQAGYLMQAWLPYLSLEASVIFSDVDNGNIRLENGGYLLEPEAGLIVDVSERFSLQAGIPFTVMGKNQMKRWGMHFSLALNFAVN